MHELEQQSALGSKWKQCKHCGMAVHSGFYWLSGRRARVEPPCPVSFTESDYLAWREAAKEAMPALTSWQRRRSLSGQG